MNYAACHRHDEYVSLNDQEYALAFSRGRQIYSSSQARKLKDYRPQVRDGVDGARVQALGEVATCAVAKLLCLPYRDTLDSFHGADLEFNIEVRLIGRDWFGLRVYEKDHDSKRVVGVVIERGRERLPYRCPGWINAQYGKRPEYYMDPLGLKHPVYAVPQNKLFSLWMLRLLIAR